MALLTACVARILEQVLSVMFPRWEMEMGLAWRYGVSCGNCRRGMNQVSSSSGWGLGRSLAMIPSFRSDSSQGKGQLTQARALGRRPVCLESASYAGLFSS